MGHFAGNCSFLSKVPWKRNKKRWFMMRFRREKRKAITFGIGARRHKDINLCIISIDVKSMSNTW